MSGAFQLAIRYVLYNRGKTATLVASLALIAYLPIAVTWLTARFQEELVARAAATPLLMGALGSRYDLVLQSLYFEGNPPPPIQMGQVQQVAQSDLAMAIPLLIRHRAAGHPVVGTTMDYFPFRNLRIRSGQTLTRLGDCILGASVARKLDIGPGDALFTESQNVFDIAGEYPLKMRVVGVFAHSHSPDDDAVFIDIKTAWIIEGIGHGHQDLATAEESVQLDSLDNKIVANAALPKHTEITDDNIDSFHFHGDPASFPATAAILLPRDERAQTILKGRFLKPNETVQIVNPQDVVKEVLSIVAKMKQFFDAQAVMVAVATLLLVGLIVMLSVRLRRREMQTMFRIGCGQRTIFWLHASEWSIIVATAAALVAAMIWISSLYAPVILRALLF